MMGLHHLPRVSEDGNEIEKTQSGPQKQVQTLFLIFSLFQAMQRGCNHMVCSSGMLTLGEKMLLYGSILPYSIYHKSEVRSD